MKKAEVGFLISIIVFGVVLLYKGAHLPVRSEFTIGPGFLPRVVSYFMILVASGLLIQCLIKNPQSTPKIKEFINGIGLKRLVPFGVLFVGFIFSIKFLGILLPLWVFMVITFRFIEKNSWFSSIGVSTLSVLIFYAIFKMWLGIPLPGINL